MSALKETLKSRLAVDFWSRLYNAVMPNRMRSDSRREMRLMARRMRLGTILFFLGVIPLIFWLFWGTVVTQSRIVMKGAMAFANMKVANVMVDVQKDGISVPQDSWHVDTNSLKQALPFQLEQSILDIDPEEVRSNINDLSWIKKVRVRLRLPDTVLIVMEERQPFALWQQEGKFYLIDEEGNRITSKNLAKYGHLPWLVGDGANTAAKDYITLLAGFPELTPSIKAAYRLGGRRWILKMKNNIEVKLSETDPRQSLLQLVNLETKYHILKRDIEIVDLRVVDKTYIQVSSDVKASLSGAPPATPTTPHS